MEGRGRPRQLLGGASGCESEGGRGLRASQRPGRQSRVGTGAGWPTGFENRRETCPATFMSRGKVRPLPRLKLLVASAVCCVAPLLCALPQQPALVQRSVLGPPEAAVTAREPMVPDGEGPLSCRHGRVETHLCVRENLGEPPLSILLPGQLEPPCEGPSPGATCLAPSRLSHRSPLGAPHQPSPARRPLRPGWLLHSRPGSIWALRSCREVVGGWMKGSTSEPAVSGCGKSQPWGGGQSHHVATVWPSERGWRGEHTGRALRGGSPDRRPARASQVPGRGGASGRGQDWEALCPTFLFR